MIEPSAAGPERFLRSGLLAIAGLGVIGTLLELALARHWSGPLQVLPWVVLIALGAATLALVRRPGPASRRAARAVATLAFASGLLGVYKHVEANHEAGPLDAVYGARWDAMSGLSQWWHALIESVGPSPSFAPGATALIGLCLLVATHGSVPAAGTAEDSAELSARFSSPTRLSELGDVVPLSCPDPTLTEATGLLRRLRETDRGRVEEATYDPHNPGDDDRSGAPCRDRGSHLDPAAVGSRARRNGAIARNHTDVRSDRSGRPIVLLRRREPQCAVVGYWVIPRAHGRRPMRLSCGERTLRSGCHTEHTERTERGGGGNPLLTGATRSILVAIRF